MVNKKNLVIVESPSKARTVGRFLGNDYEVKASMGHVRDLPGRNLGVEITEEGFEPKYRILSDKRKIVSELTKASKEAKIIYLATDPDREGEAISWHLIKAAKIDEAKTRRVEFHEITRPAIEEAFASPRKLDIDLIDAQQARRVLDRLVGYRLSPVLWRIVQRGTSAGRVQSVALRMVVDREKEIQKFEPKEYWTIEAKLALSSTNDDAAVFEANLHSYEGLKGKIHIEKEEVARNIINDLSRSEYKVSAVVRKKVRRRPSAPFITSTLQQEASRKLSYSPLRTMRIAQQLYEGLEIGKEGHVGLITYMRTDSTQLSTTALQEAAEYIDKKYGGQYTKNGPRRYSRSAKGAQEAHEAVRPTSINRDPQSLKAYLDRDQFRLYDLIWKRMLASQMPDALFDRTEVTVEASGLGHLATVYFFRATGSVMTFAGFRALYIEGVDDVALDGRDVGKLPNLDVGVDLTCHGITPKQHFTEPPPRYSEASLIRNLEKEGIGRPSTYASITGTIQERDYVRKDRGRFVPTKLGTAVTSVLVEHFTTIMDVGFTASVEELLDDIAGGDLSWNQMLMDFYRPFDVAVERAAKEAQRIPRDQIDEDSGEVCEKCERPMVIRSGRNGRFVACTGYPECKNTRSVKIGVSCPECDPGDIVERKWRGKTFYGCSCYPECKFSINRRPITQKCPECQGILGSLAGGQVRCFRCNYRGPKPNEDEEVGELALKE